jgi:hypothetical protein
MRHVIVDCLIVAGSGGMSYASQDEFCAGFREGYRMVAGNVVVPVCPVGPVPPVNTTSYQMGMEEGIEAAGGKLMK